MAALLACGVRKIPEHLQPDPPDEVEVTPPESLDQAIGQLLGRDPLARRPNLPEQLLWPDPAMDAWLQTVRAHPGDPATLDALESRFPGSVAVPLGRGWRLAALELQASDGFAADRQALAWMSVLTVSGPVPQSSALGWMRPELRVPYAEQRVLRGWLDGPEIPLAAVSERMRESAFDRLTNSPEGQILHARAHAQPVGEPPSLADLDQLVTLFLEAAAADRDSEQARHQEHIAALPSADLAVHASTLHQELAPQAAHPNAAGGALLAWEIQRWTDDTCSGCVGLDRVEGMARASRWDPGLEAMSAVAQVAALKDALDGFEVGLEHQRFRPRPLLDALTGTGAGPLPGRLLERSRPDSTVWLELSRACAGADSTSQEETLDHLNAWLVSAVDAALALNPSADQVPLLERIRARAL
jgi:hypothetical protein